jgi:predicted secreted Zn-dependent protease
MSNQHKKGKGAAMKLIFYLIFLSTAFINAATERIMIGGVQCNVRTRILHYNIQESNYSGIKNAFLETSARNGWSDAAAFVDWDIKYGADLVKNRDGTCRLDNAYVTLEVTYMLPKLTTYGQCSRALQVKWDSYYSAVLKHEKGHADIARFYAAMFARELNHLRKLHVDCTKLQNAMQNLKRRFKQKCSDVQHRYDKKTFNGAKQGMIW